MYGTQPTVAPIREACFRDKGQSSGLKASAASVCYCYSQTYDGRPARRTRRAGFESVSLKKYSVSRKLLCGTMEWSGERISEESMPSVTMSSSG